MAASAESPATILPTRRGIPFSVDASRKNPRALIELV